ncbi:hypothetical protein CARUB_v10019582mg [Capsella rubella]|uniref:FBD domain-containing protein n=1 Tax=Capsella rubella TaxID=81985 RepID=R0FUD0_9BRAS|nr:F-box protein At3g62230 [Capsella rubella]EOA26146.1 hypothetical protein CARUB_v10019582mg [Capsella rubella]
MDAGNDGVDLISMLSDFLLVLIVSRLSFKDCLKTSVLSKRWNHIHREGRNIRFNEREITRTYPAEDDLHTKRARFVQYMVEWVSLYAGGIIESFELTFSKPVGFEEEMKTLIDFAASRKVQNLVLDFSDRQWVNREEVEATEAANMIQIPESFYNLTTLVTLKLLACRFEPSKLAGAASVVTLYFGWMQLTMFSALLLKTPLLESLSIKRCWNVGLEAITGYNSRLLRLVFKNCGFAVQSSTLELPSILEFKYAGRVHFFGLSNVNKSVDEVSLDFGRESVYHEGLGNQLRDLLSNLASAKTKTICPFLIQVIQSAYPLRLKAEMETRQLVLKTNLEPIEFTGISFMIKSCAYLETLTFQLVVSMPVQMMVPHVDAETFWSFSDAHACMINTLKNIEIWNFCGGRHEMEVLKYLIRLCRVLDRVDIYLPMGLTEDQSDRFRAAAEEVGTTFERGSEEMTIYLH